MPRTKSVVDPNLKRILFDVAAVAILTGWSQDHAHRHLQHLFYSGSKHVLNTAIGKRRRHLEITREGLDELLDSMSGAALNGKVVAQ